MSDDVRVLKLSNGEELVAVVKGGNGDWWQIEKPLALMYDFKQGNLTFGFAPIPWMPLAKEIQLNRHQIAADAVPEAMVLQAYQKATGVIMTPPEKKLIV